MGSIPARKESGQFGSRGQTRVGEHGNLTHKAMEHLRDAIYEGDLAPGARVIERAIAEEMGISRVPVREGIQQLVEEGLLTKISYHGAFVSSPSRRDIEEISSLRILLECFIAARVVARWEPAHDVYLQRIVDEMWRALDEKTIRRIHDLDLQFHMTLGEISDHFVLQNVLSRLHSLVGRFMFGAMKPESLDLSVRSHVDLLDAFRTGDVVTAQEEVERHITNATDLILSHLEDQSLRPS